MDLSPPIQTALPPAAPCDQTDRAPTPAEIAQYRRENLRGQAISVSVVVYSRFCERLTAAAAKFTPPPEIGSDAVTPPPADSVFATEQERCTIDSALALLEDFFKEAR
jgi:hypothetical protein